MIRNKFIITVPVYNALTYVEDCLNSIKSQIYKDYEVFVVDDCSTDGTWEIVKKCEKIDNFHVFRNDVRSHSPIGNIVRATKEANCKDKDIIVNVDGDDQLSSIYVLSCLNWAYQNKDVWATYGQFSSSQYSLCQPISNHRVYRKENVWKVGHLRTYKKWLFDLIKDKDLRDEDGEYYKFAGDCALIYPIVEMCGSKHLKYIDTVLYMYNNDNYLNEWRVDEKQQDYIKNKIKSKDPYDEL